MTAFCLCDDGPRVYNQERGRLPGSNARRRRRGGMRSSFVQWETCQTAPPRTSGAAGGVLEGGAVRIDSLTLGRSSRRAADYADEETLASGGLWRHPLGLVVHI